MRIALGSPGMLNPCPDPRSSVAERSKDVVLGQPLAGEASLVTLASVKEEFVQRVAVGIHAARQLGQRHALGACRAERLSLPVGQLLSNDLSHDLQQLALQRLLLGVGCRAYPGPGESPPLASRSSAQVGRLSSGGGATR